MSGQAVYAEQCCSGKIVEGVKYVLTEENSSVEDQRQYGCKNDCVYEQPDEPGQKYCFKNGIHEVTCINENATQGEFSANKVIHSSTHHRFNNVFRGLLYFFHKDL